MAQVRFTSWLRELVPEAAIAADGATVGDALSAVDLVRVAAEAIGGKGGGGRPDMAQAGGPDNGNPGAALDAIRKKLGELATV